jgi:uncharacterized protein
MRIAFVVDVHGRFETVAEAMRSMGEADLLVVGGDITTAGTPDDARRAIESWRPLAASLVALAGNMDSPEIDALLGQLGVGLDGRGIAFGEVGLVGVSAAPTSPLRTPYELSEEELAYRIAKGFDAISACRVKIFCPHAPPRGTACDRLRNGEHVGSVAVRKFVEREHPDVVLCGHIHEARGIDELDGSRVVNPGPVFAGHYAVVEVDEAVSVRLDDPASP